MISKKQEKLIRLLEQKKYRLREKLFVAEGPKVVGDLLSRQEPAAVFATEEFNAPHHINIQTVTDTELRRISFLQHPQQVLALFPLPESPIKLPFCGKQTEAENGSRSSLPLVLALDGVQDPGNLGTIIRIADWFGINHIVCSEDTADAWSPKVVQATMGSIARVEISYTDLPSMLDGLPKEIPVYGTLLDGHSIYSEELSAGGIIIMGNEGKGLTQQVRRRINRRLLIPSYHQGNTAESLNVAIATAIVCAEFRRRDNAYQQPQLSGTTRS